MSPQPGPADAESAWILAFAGGQLRDPAISTGTGERVALRLADVVVAIVEPGPWPQVTQLLHRGPVVVTDRRVMTPESGGPEWSWSDRIASVFAEASGWGVIVVPTEDAAARGARSWAILDPAVLDPQPSGRLDAAPWSRIVAVWRASRGELNTWVNETAPGRIAQHQATALSLLTGGERRFISAREDLRRRYDTGGLRKIGKGQSTFYAPGEKLLLRVPSMCRRRIAVTADREAIKRGEFLDDPGPLRGQCLLYVTDRRAALVRAGKTVGEWQWNDLADVTVIKGGGGVRFLVHEDDLESDAALRIYHPYLLFQPSEMDVVIKLSLVVDAFMLGTDRDVDSWFGLTAGGA